MKNQINFDDQNTKKIGQSQHTELLKKVRYIPFFVAGIIVASTILTVFFYVFLVPRYEKNLNKLVQEKEQALRNAQGNNTQNNVPTQSSSTCPNCVDQTYNSYNVKEFYSTKIEEASWVKFQS